MSFHHIWQPSENIKVLNVLPYQVDDSTFSNLKYNKKLILAVKKPPQYALENGSAIAIPGDKFHISELLEQLPSGFSPDVIHISLRNYKLKINGLKKVSCSKVLKIGDSFQHGDGSLSQMLDQAKTFECDYHWNYQTPHHLYQFKLFGLPGVFYCPGSIALESYTANEVEFRNPNLIFRGRIGLVHGYRSQVISELQKNNLLQSSGVSSYEQTLKDYESNQISLNCSANGDINRRFFEILMAGGFLLTDKPSKYFPLSDFLKNENHFVYYKNIEDLLLKSKSYINDPQKCLEISKNGLNVFLKHFKPDLVRQQFYEHVTNQKNHFNIEFDDRPKVVVSEKLDFFNSKRSSLIHLYEIVQEIHQQTNSITIDYFNKDQTKYQVISKLFSDLPRITNSKDQDNLNILILFEEEMSHSEKQLERFDFIVCANSKFSSKSKTLKPFYLVSISSNKILNAGKIKVYANIKTNKQRLLKHSNVIKYFTQILKDYLVALEKPLFF